MKKVSMRTWEGQQRKFKSEMLKPIILAKPKKQKAPERQEHEVANVKGFFEKVHNYKKYRSQGERNGQKFLKNFEKVMKKRGGENNE